MVQANAPKDFSYLIGMPQAEAEAIMSTLSLDDKMAAMNTLFSSLNRRMTEKIVEIATSGRGLNQASVDDTLRKIEKGQRIVDGKAVPKSRTEV